MEKYTGVCCPVCSKAFDENDDIVVCPDCGAPHHRACYKELGRCAFTEQHTPGNYWKNPNEEALAPRPEKPGAAVPPVSAQAQSQDAAPDYAKFFTPEGGTPPAFSQQQADNIKRLGVSLDEELDGVPVKDIAQFVGPNSFYYLPRFKLLAMKRPFFNLNAAAMITGFFYYFHRKMYKLGAALLALFIATSIPQFILSYLMFPQMFAWLTVAGLPQPVIPYTGLAIAANILNYVYFAALLASGLFANKLYYGFTLKKVRGIRESFRGREESECMRELTLHGRTNKIIIAAVAVALIAAFFIYSGFVAASYPLS